MTKMHIVVEIVSPRLQVKYEGSDAQLALDFLLTHSEVENASMNVHVIGNAEPILVLAGIAEMQRRNARAVEVGYAVRASGHLTYNDRTDGIHRNRK